MIQDSRPDPFVPLLFDALGRTPEARAEAYRSLIKTALDGRDLNAIRSAVQGGGVLGSDRFRESIRAALGARGGHAMRGRPRTMSKQASLVPGGD